MNDLTIRAATTEDVSTIIAHRHAMFVDMGYEPGASLDEMSRLFETWLRDELANGEYRGWFVTNEDEIAAGGGVWITDMPPHPSDPTSLRGLVMNVYTRPEYRRRGLARQLMEVILEWCGDNGVRIVLLNASDDGRPLYESLGFEDSTGDMILLLKR